MKTIRVRMLASRFGPAALMKGQTYDLPLPRGQGLVAAGQAELVDQAESAEAPPATETADAPAARPPAKRAARKAASGAAKRAAKTKRGPG